MGIGSHPTTANRWVEQKRGTQADKEQLVKEGEVLKIKEKGKRREVINKVNE